MKRLLFAAFSLLALAACNSTGTTSIPTTTPAAPMGEARIGTGDAAPYPLTTCIVSGKELGETAVTFAVAGQTFRTCCTKCQATIESDPETWIAKLSEASIADQLANYPIDVCVVSGKPLPADCKTATHDGKIVKFCCATCADTFAKDPIPYLARLDTARSSTFASLPVTTTTWTETQTKEWIAMQRATYPLSTCVVTGKPLYQVEAPFDTLIEGTLVRLCCKECEAKARENAAATVATVQSAAFAQQKKTYPLGTCAVTGKTLADDAVSTMVGTVLVRTCCTKCAAKVAEEPMAGLVTLTTARTAMTQKAEGSCCGTGESCCCTKK